MTEGSVHSGKSQAVNRSKNRPQCFADRTLMRLILNLAPHRTARSSVIFTFTADRREQCAVVALKDETLLLFGGV